MNTVQRFTFQLEAIVPPGKTQKEAIEWVQRFFDYYHPTLEVRVSLNGEYVEGKKEVKK